MVATESWEAERDRLPRLLGATTHLFLFSGLVHFGLQEINEFSLLRDCAFHFHFLMRVENLKSMGTRTASEVGRSIMFGFVALRT